MKFPKFANPFDPPPAPPGFGQGKVVPESKASPLSRLLFHWLSPFLEVGYSRPLQEEDLWQLPPEQLTGSLADRLESNFYLRCAPESRPRVLRERIRAMERLSPASEGDDDGVGSDSTKAEKKQKPEPVYDASLLKALHRTLFWRWWSAGILKLFGDTLKTTTPLLNKVILNWLAESYVWFRLSEEEKAAGVVPKPKGLGYGIGLAFALFVMQEAASLTTNHYFQLAMTNGLYLRASIIGCIFRKSLRLSGRARIEHSVGQITTMISSDSNRFDRFSMYAHNLWVAPIQIIIVVALLVANLGYSALVGLGVLLLGFPLQMVLGRVMFKQRRKGVKLTDSRVRLVTEVLQGIRLLKFYAWEDFYWTQTSNIREKEIKTIRKAALARSSLISLVTFTPILSSVLSFITYALSGHQLTVGTIFASLQLFNVIRMPLFLIPLVLSVGSDVLVALGRVSAFLVAEELEEPYIVDQACENAVEVNADFVWESVGKVDGSKFAGASDGGKGKKGRGKEKGGPVRKRKGEKKGEEVDSVLPTTRAENDGEKPKVDTAEKPFELSGLKVRVPRGAFVAIVGRVGAGKSSILQALIGEMRRTRGQVVFGGSVAYVPQTAWIRNATLRENVLFGREDDEKRFHEVIRACSLERDMETLPDGEDTDIGEKGINLSGGQKARVSLARAAYSDPDIALLDDPLSAVDAYVGKKILEDCLLDGPLSKKTRILVTHALHVLDKTDYILVVENGKVTDQGTYDNLVMNSPSFARLMEEYGRREREEEKSDDNDEVTDAVRRATTLEKSGKQGEVGKKKDAVLMQAEERFTGAVTWSTYARYLKFAGGVVWAPTLLVLLALSQGAQVGNNLFLGFWTAGSVHGFRQGDYMTVYALLGVAQAFFSFCVSFSFALATLSASLNLFRAAFRSVLRSPVSFFDTTPLGRILSRLSKDQDTLDAELAQTLYQFLTTFSSVLGTVALVFYTFPYLGIIFVPLSIIYMAVSNFYRRSSVETKRLDSLMRSALYASYSETLTGLATVRAYRDQNRSINEAQRGLDMENRAYYMTISIQRWLSVRLDLLGNLLILGIALFASGFRHTVNPAKVGVVLTYSLSITQVFSDMVAQFAQNEQNMNAVERVLVYSELPSENERTTSGDPPPPWPQGEIEFVNVQMRYREGLPLVLKDVSFRVSVGEKIGIVGRTGAGKSSLLQALFRIAELQSGKIEIDGVNIREIGLDTLRGRLALVPQDSILFFGTLRENLDPLGTKTDAELISTMQRAWLLPREGPVDPVTEAKFSLDSTVSDEGSNFSAGEKQLLALCRALVKNSKIIILDEATSSVDVETDAKLQRTIQTEFADSTLLCIAHRLNTIAYYDRVLVMDDGRVAEFDSVLNLFDGQDSIFRSLCDEAHLSREDILRIREEYSHTAKAVASSS